MSAIVQFVCPRCGHPGLPSAVSDGTEMCSACMNHFRFGHPDPQQAPIKLNLGCCDRSMPGYLGVDIAPGPAVDIVTDLREQWPWWEGEVEHIIAHDIIEHLPDAIYTMNELYRVLRKGGRVEIVVPTTEGPGAWQDPTHRTYWNRRSFLYYEAGNIYRERFAKAYGIEAAFKVVGEKMDRTIDGPKLTIVLEKV